MPPSPQQYINNLRNQLSRTRKPQTLYHYTSGSGLLGIIETKSLWATNVRYLNDSKEYGLALNMTDQILDYRKERAKAAFEEALYEVMRESLKHIEATEVFVSSFSQNADQLSQWRGYCPTANGYSLGFFSKILEQSNQNEGFSFLAPCIYDESKQAELIEKIISDVLDFAEGFAKEDPDDDDRVFREAFKLFERLLPLAAPVIKHDSFDEEREWRLVTTIADFNPGDAQLRSGRSMLVPFVLHKLSVDKTPFELKRIIIGPTLHPTLARHSLEILLDKHRVSIEQIDQSEIPYRDW